MPKTAISPGDEFVKTDRPDSVWIVRRYLDYPGLPQHVELIEKGHLGSGMTIAESALQDSKLYQRLGGV